MIPTGQGQPGAGQPQPQPTGLERLQAAAAAQAQSNPPLPRPAAPPANQAQQAQLQRQQLQPAAPAAGQPAGAAQTQAVKAEAAQGQAARPPQQAARQTAQAGGAGGAAAKSQPAPAPAASQQQAQAVPPQAQTTIFTGPVELLVARYLQQKFGATENGQSAKRLIDELMKDGDKAMQTLTQEQLDANLVRCLMYEKNKVMHNPELYVDQYEQLREWVYSCLDMFRGELQRVLFPVFVHCYLELVAPEKDVDREKARNASRTLLDRYSEDHKHLYGYQLVQLAAVTDAAKAEQSPIAKLYREKKATVPLSREATGLLLRFLQSSQCGLITSVMNEHIVMKEAHRGIHHTGEDEMAALLMEDAGKDGQGKGIRINSQGGLWGVLKDSALYEGLTAAPKPAPPAGAPARKPVKLDTVAAKVSVPGLPLLERERAVEEYRTRHLVSAQALPSVCAYTLSNSAGRACCSALSPDCSAAVAGYSDSSVLFWDMREAAQAHKEAVERMERAAEAKAALGLDDMIMVGPTQVAKIEREAEVAKEAEKQARPGPPQARLTGHAAPVYGVAFMPGSDYIISGSADQTVRIWSVELGRCLHAFRGHQAPVWAVATNPHGHYFASASNDCTAMVWSVDHPDARRVLTGHDADVDCITWHNNGAYVATGSTDKTVRVWDVSSGECIRILLGPRATPRSLCFSPDGTVLAAAADDGQVHLWDLASAKVLAHTHAHTGPAWGLDFSAEGNLLATGGADRTVRLWDVAWLSSRHAGGSNLSCAKVLPTKSAPAFAVRFSRQNLLFAVGPRQ